MKKPNKNTTKLKIKKYVVGGVNTTPNYTLGYNAIGSSSQPILTEEEIAAEEEKLGRALTNTERTKLAVEKQQLADAEQQQKETESSIKTGLGTLSKAAAKDAKEGVLGKLFVPKTPIDAGTASQAAFDTASTAAPTAASAGYLPPVTVAAPYATEGTSIIGSASLAPNSTATAVDLTSKATSAGTAGSNAASAASTAASAAPQMSALASAGIGVGLNIGGRVIEERADDDNPFTFDKKEARGNIAGSAMKSAGTGFGIGAAAGSIIPGVGNVVGGVIGGAIGAGVGVVKGIKENKESKKTKEELWNEQNKQAGAFNSAFVRSRLSGTQSGFGYQSSTNMNMQSTPSFYAELGGAKPLPGGYEIPIGPNGEVKYVGNTHAEGGIMESPNTEVEDQETKDIVLMKKQGGAKPKEYFFSEYLKLGGKSFAKIHENMVKSGASQEQIQALAKKQEEKAGRSTKQIAMYGGVRKYQTGDFKMAPEPNEEEIIDNPMLTETTQPTQNVVSQNQQLPASQPATYTTPQTTTVPTTTVNAQATQYNEPAKTAEALPSSKIGTTKEAPEYWGSMEAYNTAWKPLVKQSLATDEQVTNIATALQGLDVDAKTKAEINRRINAAGGNPDRLRAILESEATDEMVGPFHKAMLDAINKTKAPADVKQQEVTEKKDSKEPETPAGPQLEEEFKPCPPGQYRNQAGVCTALPVGKMRREFSPTALFGMAQLIPPAYALLNPYQMDRGIKASASVKGAVLPRVNMNQERASSIQGAQAITKNIQNTNAGPGGIAAQMAVNSKVNDQMLAIANQEQEANKQLAAEEARLGQRASEFNVEQAFRQEAANAELRVGEKRYKREETLGALDTAVSRAAGFFTDQQRLKVQKDVARALDETGSFDRFEFKKRALKDSKRKSSPYYGMSEYDINQVTAAMFPSGAVVSQTKINTKQKDTEEKKRGGVKKYVSRLGQLNYNKTKI